LRLRKGEDSDVLILQFYDERIVPRLLVPFTNYVLRLARPVGWRDAKIEDFTGLITLADLSG
jgi:hypothetical protein